jgi:hypothetical protein
MFQKTFCAFFSVVGLLAVALPAQAQIYIPHTTTHIDYVPHTTTHLDHIRHGNHYHSVPHTTTHFDAVPHTTTHYDAVPYGNQHSSYYGGYQSYRPSIYSSYRSTYQRAPHTSTHLDIVPHGGHYHIVPHTTSNRHRH